MTKVRTHTDYIDTARIAHLTSTIPTHLGRRNDLLPSHVVLKMLQNQPGSTGTAMGTATVCFKVSAKWLLSRLL